MLDIVQIVEGEDLVLADTAVMKAANVITTQLGSLEYAPDFGADLKYFLETNVLFQNASFKAYIVQRLAENQINVSDVMTTVQELYEQYLYSVNDQGQNEVKGFIR